MKILSVDPFYLRMPEITTAADGTQDTLVVRIRTDRGIEGWGECDASPLVSLAAYCCPMSHGNIISIRDSLLGETIETPEDVRRLHAKALRNGSDIEQIDHAYAGADIALWDLVGKHLGMPVYRLLGGKTSHPKTPYASVLFGDTPEDTLRIARGLRERGFRAAKFGWGPMGKKDAETDVALVRAAREGLGPEPELMVDAGWAWGRNVEAVLDRARRFAPYRLTWLEEPLFPDALPEYGRLAGQKPAVAIAAGENAATLRQAENYIDQARLSFIQIDAGRIGGITVARKVAERARAAGISYVNHTFKSRLSVAAAIHAFADVEAFRYLEYPSSGSALSEELAPGAFDRDAQGEVRATETPGLGVTVNPDCLRKYSAPVRIDVGGRTIFSSVDV
ncbi:MAG TPA: mandelate racemase/muconate lactonizing enzyme family protein [Planctomycetota bacterium]|nr:mandelate racemase/muconate lactonizing enzyme family protein [Planctomycetota bacterium]